MCNTGAKITEDLKNNAKITDYYVRAQSLAQQQQIIERAKRCAARNSRVVREAADDEDSDDDDWGSEDAVAQSMTTSVADWNDLSPQFSASTSRSTFQSAS